MKEVHVNRATARLYEYVARHPDYLDRDRDILLLHLVDRIEELTKQAEAEKGFSAALRSSSIHNRKP
jgi:hypothetical protein